MTSDIDAHIYFGRHASTYGGDYKDIVHNKYPANRFRLNIVKELLTKISPKEILDVGCGTGDPLVELNKMGFCITGFDYSSEMVREARKNASRNGIDERIVFQDDIENPDTFGEKQYDCILALGSVYYARNFDGAMDNICSSLRNKGHLIMSLRNDLFSLFSMNQYTAKFICDNLVHFEGLSNELREELVNMLDRKFNEDKDIGLKKAFLTIDEEGVYSSSHNPLTVEETVLKPHGLELDKLYYYHFHALPPVFEHIHPKEFRDLSEKMESGNDWRGIFMCSSFIVHATKV